MRKWVCRGTRTTSLFLKHKHWEQLHRWTPHNPNPPLLGFLNRPEHALASHSQWVRSVELFLDEALNLSSPFLYKARAHTLRSSHTQLSRLDITPWFQPHIQKHAEQTQKVSTFSLISAFFISGHLHIIGVKEQLAQILAAPDSGKFTDILNNRANSCLDHCNCLQSSSFSWEASCFNIKCIFIPWLLIAFAF